MKIKSNATEYTVLLQIKNDMHEQVKIMTEMLEVMRRIEARTPAAR
jgi:hypothetical protein